MQARRNRAGAVDKFGEAEAPTQQAECDLGVWEFLQSSQERTGLVDSFACVRSAVITRAYRCAKDVEVAAAENPGLSSYRVYKKASWKKFGEVERQLRAWDNKLAFAEVEVKPKLAGTRGEGEQSS